MSRYVQNEHRLEKYSKLRDIDDMSVSRTSYFQRLSNSFKKSWLSRPAMLQVAALCYRPTDDGHEILLVTTRGSGKWILPKGWPKAKIGAAETALLEAFEEAGIRGRVIGDSIGQYHDTKTSKKGATLDFVIVIHEVLLTEIMDDFPEKGERKVAWFAPEAAAEAVSNPELAEILRGFRPSA